ncbi:hypothetical protein EMIT043CA1_100072 [Pseudomonas brassicacearum]
MVMGLESTSGSLSQDIVNGGRAARIFEHLQGMAQGQVLGEFIEFESTCQRGQAQQQHQQIAHLSPSAACPVESGSPPFPE